ncbi:unnamed protein product, partial [Iphiclides podalirius]
MRSGSPVCRATEAGERASKSSQYAARAPRERLCYVSALRVAYAASTITHENLPMSFFVRLRFVESRTVVFKDPTTSADVSPSRREKFPVQASPSVRRRELGSQKFAKVERERHSRSFGYFTSLGEDP